MPGRGKGAAVSEPAPAAARVTPAGAASEPSSGYRGVANSAGLWFDAATGMEYRVLQAGAEHAGWGEKPS